ncbi:MAG: hypothetical protein EB168_08115 [Euryarchaeota archaeon]|jgi:hypothetical protein|nr:hypothetical protein [Euryarchaeota archaeon]
MAGCGAITLRGWTLFTYMAHEISDFIDSVKESLTDHQYKEGMELCKTVFEAKKREKKLYKMTYLAPYTFHAEGEGYTILRIAFQKKTGLVQLNEHDVKFIEHHHRFTGDEGDLESFIDTDPLNCFPLESDSLDGVMEWWEFPVLSLEECG